MPLLLTVRADPAAGGPLAIDVAGIVPDRLADLSGDAVRRIPIRADERPCQIGDVFAVSGDLDDGVIECRGDFSRVHHVASGMASGTIRVTGNVGRHAGEAMIGGRLDVAGDAGDWLAVEMTGGQVVVTGSAGDNAAGALPGSHHGLRGGTVIVQGDVGQLAGQRMRRGILAIGGRCGPAAAFEMRAGTVVLAGGIGPHPGLGMRRGSLVALAAEPMIPATFCRGRAWNPSVLGLLLTSLSRLGFHPSAPLPARWRHWHGDLVTGCRGEILCPDPA
jgi:formylmethanofuran dehydrogenase subunit C